MAAVVACVGSMNFAPAPIASTETASTTNVLPWSTKPNRAWWARSNATFITSGVSVSTISGVSVPA